MTDMQTVPTTARVLVVEDDETNQMVAYKLLQLAGVPPNQVDLVDGDPISYLKAKRSQNFDLILLDLHLPKKDGYDVLAELRGHAEFAHIPVVALTADVVQVNRAQAAGFDGFIPKPIDGVNFPRWIRRLLTGESVWITD